MKDASSTAPILLEWQGPCSAIMGGKSVERSAGFNCDGGDESDMTRRRWVGEEERKWWTERRSHHRSRRGCADFVDPIIRERDAEGRLEGAHHEACWEGQTGGGSSQKG